MQRALVPGLFRRIGSSVISRGARMSGIGCNSLDEKATAAISCKKPEKAKAIPPYRYGYCREADPPVRMSCPPKVKRLGRGPCCHETANKVRGGSKVN